MRRTRKQLSKLLIGTGLLLGLGSAAQASFITNILTPNTQNDFEDQSREAFIDASGDGVFGLGDIYTGFLRFDDKTQPNFIDLENHVYAIFSQEVVATPSSNTVEFGPVTSDPSLTLAGLGVLGAGPQDTFAVFSSEATPTGFSVDLIGASPGDLTGNGTVTLADYFDVILSEGTLDMIAGIYDLPTCTGGTTDCFQGTSNALANGTPTGVLLTLGSGVTTGNFLAGVETSLDPDGFTILDTTQAGAFAPPAATLTIADLAISNGASRATQGVINAAEWINASELTSSPQCTPLAGGSAVPCGLIDDADFAFFPSVPEPATIALLGSGLFGLGAVRRRRRRH